MQLLKQGFYGIQDIAEELFRAYKITAHAKRVPL
jgi:hypothetical protein